MLPAETMLRALCLDPLASRLGCPWCGFFVAQVGRLLEPTRLSQYVKTDEGLRTSSRMLHPESKHRSLVDQLYLDHDTNAVSPLGLTIVMEYKRLHDA